MHWKYKARTCRLVIRVTSSYHSGGLDDRSVTLICGALEEHLLTYLLTNLSSTITVITINSLMTVNYTTHTDDVTTAARAGARNFCPKGSNNSGVWVGQGGGGPPPC